MRIIKLTGETRANLLSDLIKRSPDDYGPYEATVKEIVADVHKRGDEAVLEYTAKFDKADLTPETMRVTEAEIEEAYAAGFASAEQSRMSPDSFFTGFRSHATPPRRSFRRPN